MRFLSLVRNAAAVALLAGALPLAANAQTSFYSNFGAGNSFDSGTFRQVGTVGPSTNQSYAMQFVAQATGTADSVTLALSKSNALSGIRVFIVADDTTGYPVNPLLGSPAPYFDVTRNDITSSSPAVYTFSSGVGAPLSQGGVYWVIVTDYTDPAGYYRMYSNNIGDVPGTNNQSDRVAVGGNYVPEDNLSAARAAFSVTGIAAAESPEPGSLALLMVPGVGFALGIVRRRRA